MKTRRLLLSIATLTFLMGGVGAASAGNITYDLVDYPAFQNGYSLSGAITTDGQIGELTYTDVLAWQVTITPPGGLPFEFDAAQPGSSLPIFKGVTADLQFITLIATPAFDVTANEAFFAGPPSLGSLLYQRDSPLIHDGFYLGAAPGVVWTTPLGPTDLGGDPWIIATVPTTDSAVPEPSTLVISSILFAVVWSYNGLKKRMAAASDGHRVS